MDNNKKIKIIEIISKITKVDSKLINENSDMDDFYKWDSLYHLSIMLELEKKFKKKINTSKMGDLNSVKKILKFLN
jgi:acyl carrier protein